MNPAIPELFVFDDLTHPQYTFFCLRVKFQQRGYLTKKSINSFNGVNESVKESTAEANGQAAANWLLAVTLPLIRRFVKVSAFHFSF
jgi:hypothetical protein